jgi:hypothetical protein
MRSRSGRKACAPGGSRPFEGEGDDAIGATASSSVRTEQLNTASPLTGLSHRTVVPIVRNTLGES